MLTNTLSNGSIPNDEVLEWCARLIEGPDMRDYCGAFSEGEENQARYKIRMEARSELRRELSGFLRGLQGGDDLTVKNTLKRLSSLTSEADHSSYLVEAWPLSWMGLVDIHAMVKCNSNWSPPQASYVISLTEKGKAMLA